MRRSGCDTCARKAGNAWHRTGIWCKDGDVYRLVKPGPAKDGCRDYRKREA